MTCWSRVRRSGPSSIVEDRARLTLEQPFHLVQLLRRLPDQLGVLHCEGHLRRHRLDETDLGGSDGPAACPPHEEDAPRHLAAHERRREQDRARPDRRHEREVVAPVGQIVRRPDRPALAEGLIEQLHGNRGRRECGPEIRGTWYPAIARNAWRVASRA